MRVSTHTKHFFIVTAKCLFFYIYAISGHPGLVEQPSDEMNAV